MFRLFGRAGLSGQAPLLHALLVVKVLVRRTPRIDVHQVPKRHQCPVLLDVIGQGLKLVDDRGTVRLGFGLLPHVEDVGDDLASGANGLLAANEELLSTDIAFLTQTARTGHTSTAYQFGNTFLVAFRGSLLLL